MENIYPHLIKRFAKVLIDLRYFLELKCIVVNIDTVLVMQRVKLKSMYIVEMIKVD